MWFEEWVRGEEMAGQFDNRCVRNNSRDVDLRQGFIFIGEKEQICVDMETVKRGVCELHIVMCVSEGRNKQLSSLSQSWQSRNGLTCSLASWEGYKCHVDVFQE